MIKLQISIPFINTFIGLIFQIYRYLLELVRTCLRPAVSGFLSLFIILIFFCSGLSAQTTGLIYKPATGAGKAVLDPNGDGYTSPTSAGFSGTDYLTGSELKMVAIPQLDTEPSGDLATGSSGGHTDIVDAGSNRKSVFVMSDGTNLIIRFRIGNASTASKGYSILIDTDNSFAGSGANPGFEQEIVLETGTNGRIAVYNHTLGVGTLSSSYNIEDNHQRSVALTTNNGDADYFYDFFVPLSAVSGNPVRFAAATITSAGSGITGTISDVDGVNDLNYSSNVPAMLTAVVSSFPSSSLTTMTAGSTFAPAQSSAPYISSSVLTTSTAISGTSAEPNGATITAYKNGVSIGTTSVSSSAWTLSGITGGTFSAGNVITAKAQDNTAGKTLSNVSNSVIVGQICTSAPVITGDVNGGKGYSGNWTPLAGQSITANSVRIYIHGISAETVTIGGQNFVTGQAFTITTNDAGNPVYVTANATVGSSSTWSFPLFNTGNSVPKGTYWATAENISTGSCVSNTSNLEYRTIPATTAPVITSSPVYDSDNQVSGTKITNAKLFFYVNGVERLTISASPNSTSWTATGLNLVVGDKLTAKAIVDGTSGLSLASNEITVQDLLNGTTAAPVIAGTYNNTQTTVNGTSTEGAGTLIRVFKNTVSIGTATVNIFGSWTLSSISLATNDLLTATAIANNKNVSPLSSAVTVLGPTTNVPSVNSPVYANSTSIGGTLASGVLRVYVDGEPLSPSLTSQSGNWTYSTIQLATLASELYAGAQIKATNTESGKLESAKSSAVSVVGVNNFLVEKAGGGNIATQTAGIAFPVKITARDGSNSTFTTYTGKNVFSSGSTISEGSGPTSAFSSGILSSHNITLTKAGSYTLRTVGTDNPSVSGTSNVFLINPSSAHNLQIFQQSSAAVTSEVTFPQQPVIYVYDQYGNHVSSDNTTQVSVSIATGTGGTLNGVKTLTAVNGVITFSGLNIQGSGPYTLQFAAAGLTSVSSGSITVTVSTPPAPTSLSYTTPNNFTTGLAITNLTPTVTGTVASYSVSPALPAGLALNTGTGLISGTPTVAVAQASYTVTATNSGGSTDFAISITVVGGAAPTATLVAISGTTTVGQILTGNFTYNDADNDLQGTSTYRWLSSTTSGGTYTAINGANSATYTLAASDQGKFIKFEVTPISATGTPSTGTAVQSSATAAIQGRAPIATAIAITGTTTVGQTLSGTYTFTDSDTDAEGTSTYQWLSSSLAGGPYTAITGATSQTYVLTSADQGKFIKFEVTPLSATGMPSTGTAASSSATAAIQGRAPIATAMAITGTTTVGQTLSGTYTFTDSDTDAEGTSTYLWLSSSLAGGPYTAITGATSQTYVLTSADQGKFIKFEVTPLSATGTPSTGTAVESSATAAIQGRAPIATAMAISGTTTVGQILTGSFTYTDADSDVQGTSTYRWLSSTTSGGNYTAINGATSATYTLTASDQGKFIKFEVTPVAATGTPSTGTAALSSATAAIQGRAPIATAVAISGTTTVGQTLSATYTFTDSDMDAEGTSTYLWLSSSLAGGPYTAITGATSKTYVLTSADQGKFIKFEITPISAIGTPSTGTAALSSATAAIQGRAPIATAVAISGTTTVGQTLSGTYTFTDSDTDAEGTSTYQWLSSSLAGGPYTAITGATSQTYVLTSADQGKFIKFEITPISATGTPSTGTAALSSATAAILGRAPAATALAISGTTTVGQILTGSFTYTDADNDLQGTSTYRWLSSTTSGGTYTAISGATSATYTLTASDQGKFIKFEVTPVAATGTPSIGTAVQRSATPAIQGRAPAATAVAISGTTTVSQILTGSFSYTDADNDLQGTSTYRWLSNTTSGGTYTAISGATSATYTLTASDQGKFIKFEVSPVAATGTPSIGTAVQSSATPAILGRAPTAAAVAISGTTTVGQILTGSFTYTDADNDLQGTSTYRWLSNSSETGNYSPISGATPSTYTLTASDQGKFIKFEVTPISATGMPSTGTAVQSSATAKVQAAISNLPVFTYSSPNVYTKGSAITPLMPQNTGGAVTSYSVGPALPLGLNLNPVTGEIRGTPIAVTGQSSYMVTATNSGGSTSFNLVLTIKDILPLFTYTTPNVYTKGSVITPLVPLNTGGAVTGYSVAPDLPAGLSLNPVSGHISGTPTSVIGEAAYMVTANNSGGSASFKLVLAVKDALPILTYGSQNVLLFTRGAYIKAVVPINTGGVVSGYSVGPALPEGLSLNPSTGVISGIPTSVSPEAIYTVTANATGETKDFKISIRIDEAQPKIEVLLTATNPIKQSDGTFNVDYRVKISNKGNTVLSNMELTVDLSKVFPAPVQFKLLGVPKVSGGGIISDGNFNGISNSNLIASSSFKINSLNEPVYFSGDLKTEELLFVLNARKRSTYLKEAFSNNSMFGSSELALNDTAVVIFSLNIKPNGNFGPYAMNVLGTAQDQAGKVVSEMSTDGHLIGNTGVTSIKYPTIVSVIPNPLIGAALSVQEITRINDNSYSVKLRARIKNSGNLNLSQVKILADLANQFKKTSSFTVQSLSINTNNGLLADSKFDGMSHTNLLLTESAIGVGKENILDLMLNIQPNGVYGNYSLQLALEAFGMDSNDKVSNFSMEGLDPDRSVIDAKNNKPTVFNLPFPGPQDLVLHNNTINENNALNDIAGNFTARDMNPSAVLSYALVSGAGDSDNAKFKISGSELLAAEIFNYEQQAFYNIRVKVSNQLGQASENSFSIAVRDINEAPTLSKIPDQRIFISSDQQAIALSGISAGPEISQQTTLNLSADNPALFEQLDIVGNEIRYKLKDGALGSSTVRVDVTDDGGVLNGGINQVSRSFELKIDPLPVIIASPGIISKGFISNLLVSTQVPVTYLWSPSADLSNYKISNPVARPAKTTTYYVKVSNQFGSSITLSTTIVVLEDYNIMIPNVFSPNDDGINDSWVIENIDSYPDHVLTLFDRSGRILNQVKNYQNDWKGTANGQPLEEGTYYYTIQFLNAKNSMKKGFVSIIK